MLKRVVAVFSAILMCTALCSCKEVETMQDNLEDVASKVGDDLTLGQTTTVSSVTEPKIEPASINCSDIGVYGEVTAVHYTSSPNTVSLKLTLDDLFSIEETLAFETITVKTATDTEGEVEVEKLQVTCTEVLRVGTIGDVQNCFNYLDSEVFAGAKLSVKDNAYSTSLTQPYLLRNAPITSYIDCKSFCDTLYKELSQELEDLKAIVDGATGIVYHNVGGNEFNLTKYRLHLRAGERVKIEILDLPEGFSCEDIKFHSDKVGYATVASDGTVTGKRNGSATITVSLAGAAVYRTVMVQVY